MIPAFFFEEKIIWSACIKLQLLKRRSGDELILSPLLAQE
ncbi:hypothetical protein J2X05_003571 [Cellvibrio fibrivorans]|uniref:Uncharacterized protein n=1 Tax=Cellvibrio fibrivorans TaxID=126350 RepID=A0ABU1V272_9GAMM|nr:hypothetical protein [Cellvibrio fibrivorans]